MQKLRREMGYIKGYIMGGGNDIATCAYIVQIDRGPTSSIPPLCGRVAG